MTYLFEYIWIDGYNNLRSKTKILKSNYFLNKDAFGLICVDDIPIWNYDGSSTNQASGSNSEILLKPVKFYRDPFRKCMKNYLVLCETYNVDETPTLTNTRYEANKIFEKYKDLEPIYGIEQEFFISKNNVPIGFTNVDKNGNTLEPKPQKDYYCGNGADNIYCRNAIEEVLNNCLYCNINLTGLNAEVAPSQWEFQVCSDGINAADELMMLRYICNRTLEKYGFNMDLRPKPVNGDWNGSGCHVNFSTNIMRQENGMDNILKSIANLGNHHKESIKIYGEDNDKRLTGLHETSSMDKFTFGVANRGCSVRIPRECEKNNCGYFEDRRPSSNMDPYVVTSSLLEFIQ